MRTALANRVTPRRVLPEPLPPVALSAEQRARVHLICSVLLDYPSADWFARLPVLDAHLVGLPGEIRGGLSAFIRHAQDAGAETLQREYVTTFDLKRKCSLYLSYFATGDTRKRGTALVTFLEAYRTAGWEFDAAELPDFLPAVLEFSAVSGSAVAEALLAAHVEGIEVLRAALDEMNSAWGRVVGAVTMSLPAVSDTVRERVLDLVTEGPPVETVGLSFLGTLPAYAPTTATKERV